MKDTSLETFYVQATEYHWLSSREELKQSTYKYWQNINIIGRHTIMCMVLSLSGLQKPKSTLPIYIYIYWTKHEDTTASYGILN